MYGCHFMIVILSNIKDDMTSVTFTNIYSPPPPQFQEEVKVLVSICCMIILKKYKKNFCSQRKETSSQLVTEKWPRDALQNFTNSVSIQSVSQRKLTS